MRRLPPLGALRAFEAAARRLSFKGAAEELGLTPTAISHQVRLLEAHCGARLFRRRPRPLALTPAGEALLPVLRAGFDAFATALAAIRPAAEAPLLRLTTTNAFAARWLVPRLGAWRATHPEVPLSLIGTDRVVAPDEADLAIRYARSAPPGAGPELLRDRYFPVATPRFVIDGAPIRIVADLARRPLIRYDWLAADPLSPTWERWRDAVAPGTADRGRPWTFTFSFREEAHAIVAALAGQGVALCSDVVVADALAAGDLIKVLDFGVPGYGFYPLFTPDHPRRAAIEALVAWLRSMAGGG